MRRVMRLGQASLATLIGVACCTAMGCDSSAGDGDADSGAPPEDTATTTTGDTATTVEDTATTTPDDTGTTVNDTTPGDTTPGDTTTTTGDTTTTTGDTATTTGDTTTTTGDTATTTGDADACAPACGTHDCGDDGCGGSCGDCDDGMTCAEGQCVAASWPDAVTVLDAASGSATASGVMTDGDTIGAAWMVDDAINCHTGSDVGGSSAKLYTGPHVLYALKDGLPPYSTVTAKVTATTAGDDPRVYVLVLPKGTRALPTAVTQATACTARYNPAYNGQPVTAGWNNESDATYEVLIGVAGGQFDKGFSGTGFELAVTVASLPTPICHGMPWDDVPGDNWFPTPPTFWPDSVTSLTTNEDGDAQVTGDLADGHPICDLKFAWDSNVACFPQPQGYLYTGKTRFYALSLPKAGIATVTVTPDPGVDLSVYGLQMSTSSFYTPPNVPSAICEQSPKKNFGTIGGPGQAESLTFVSTGNPYNLLIAVTGPDGLDAGGYVLDVNMNLVADDTCGTLWQQPKLTDWPTAATQWYPAVTKVAVDAGTGLATVTGNLSTGKTLCSLAFAWQSNVACFVATQAAHFAGNHVYYALKDGVGPGETLTITVTPKDASVDVNLYGYWSGQGNFYVPPNVVSVGACEASFPQTLSGAGNPGEPESIYFENPTGNTYNYFFAVAGPSGVTSGDYTVQIVKTTPPPPFCPESLPGPTYTAWPTNMPSIAVDDEGQGSASGDLADGHCVNLTFASDAQNACFPATQNDNFEGNQVFYHLAEPIPPHSTVDITVTPAAGVDVSLYGYMAGLTNFHLPPNLPSALACEASYATKVGGNPGGAEKLHFENPTDTNYYQVVFAVSGVAGQETGAFDIDVVRDVAQPFCPESLPGVASPASWPASVEQVTLVSGAATVNGNLDDGACTNLAFAEQSTVACFPATEFDNFMGPQNFYATSIGPGDVIDIAVTPEPGVDVSLYGFQMGTSSHYIPPNVPTVATCESSYDQVASFNPGETEYIHFESPGNNTYNIFFAVSGTAYSQTGSYTVEIVRQSAPPPFCPQSLPGGPHTSWPAAVHTIALDGDGEGTASGNLSTGACSNLAFASQSSVACFPATENTNFTGNQVWYALATPFPGASVASVEVIPAAGVDVSLFGYTMALSSFFVPPYVPSISVCEASYGQSAANPGATEAITFSNPTGNSYNLFFAVTGADALTAGAFDVHVKVDTAEPWCPESLPGVPNGTTWPASVQVLTLSGGGTATDTDNLSAGDCTDLAFAWDSNVACFPATRAGEFQGNHVYYALSAPVGPTKKVTVTVTPNAGVDAAVYLYRMGTTSFYVPPFVPSVASCEFASAGGAGAVETVVLGPSNNGRSYNVFFAVAGGSGASAGGYKVDVKVE